jgi:hypothetical protein
VTIKRNQFEHNIYLQFLITQVNFTRNFISLVSFCI